MMKANIKMIDAWTQHKESPKTFHIPMTRDLMALRPGDYVKLGVTWREPVTRFPAVRAHGERFWVKVTHLAPAPMRGIVEQADMHFPQVHGIQSGEEITFEPCHIMSIILTYPDHPDLI